MEDQATDWEYRPAMHISRKEEKYINIYFVIYIIYRVCKLYMYILYIKCLYKFYVNYMCNPKTIENHFVLTRMAKIKNTNHIG